MTTHPLYVAIIWHMHQPFYRDLRTGEITLPWVRLHAAKDYLHMAETLGRYKGVHVTINMVPSLTDQLVAWANGEESDELARLAEGTGWTEDEKRTILSLAYSISWDRVIRRYGRYAELLDRRPQALANPDAFRPADYRDLLGCFNLVWIDPNRLEKDPTLARLAAKGRGYTVEDIRAIHHAQREIAAAVLPLYHRLAERGQLEISTTPYYHPILPLLMDVRSAQRASPGLVLPASGFAGPEDAAAQLQLAVEAHVRHFGARPQGLWPSEGAVSPEILPLVSAAGFTWMASDEVILGRSLGKPFQRDAASMVTDPRALYRAYRVLADGNLGPSIVFRDHELSDRIGFLYQHLPGEQAAEDLIYRLLEIRRRLNDPDNAYLVSIVLDGENAWEYYERNGDIFLNALYRQLSRREELRAVTVSEYLAQHRAAGTLARLATGSWIGGDFNTWIGDPEQNRAWEELEKTRTRLIHFESAHPGHPGLQRAWQALYSAEGSDWFWWYSHRNSSSQDALFDQLFRDNLAAVYLALGLEIPIRLGQPIRRVPAGPDRPLLAGFLTPQLTGAPYTGAEWARAAVVQPSQATTGMMQPAHGQIGRLLVGHDQHNLYLRLDLGERLDDYEIAIYLDGRSGSPVNQRILARYVEPLQLPANLALRWQIQRLPGQPMPFLYSAAGQDQWEAISPLPAALGEKVLEILLPLPVLRLEDGRDLHVLVTLVQHGMVVGQLPEREMATISLADPEKHDNGFGHSV